MKLSASVSASVKSGMEAVHPAKLLITLVRPARLERATFWFVADTCHLSPAFSCIIKHSQIRRFRFAGYRKLSAIIPNYQLSASVSASVKASVSASPSEVRL